MTRLFGIIGHPVQHSLSPLMHAAAFRELGLDARYSALPVSPQQLSRVLRALEVLGLDGLNVTVPHKTQALRAVAPERLDISARQIGALNTLVWKDGYWHGYNTDIVGLEQTLSQELRLDLAGKSVLLLGAGGAARAAAWVLAQQRSAKLVIANRTPAHAKALAGWLRRAVPGVPVVVAPGDKRAVGRLAQEADLLVNATSLGLKAGDPLPVDAAALSKRLAVLDLVYPAHGGAGGRPTTPLVAAARRRGALAVDGVPMLVYQGAESFRLWWQRPAPVAAMRRAVDAALRGN